MRTLLLLMLLFSTFAIPSFAKESTESELLHQLSTAEGIDKLLILHELQQTFLYEPKDKYYNQLILQEAQQQKNLTYESIAVLSFVAYYYRVFDSDSIYDYADRALEFAGKYNKPLMTFQVRELLVRRYIDQGHFSMGLKKAIELYDEAKQYPGNPDIQFIGNLVMALGYLNLGQNEEAIYYSNESINALDKGGLIHYGKGQAYGLLIAAYKNIGNEEMLYLYTDSFCYDAQHLIESYPKLNQADFELTCILNRTHYLIETGELDEAWEAIEEGDRLMGEKKAYLFFKYHANFNKMLYYRETGDIEKCWDYYRICYDYCHENNLESEIRNLLRFRVNTLNKIGNYDKSSQTYNKLLLHIDSVNQNRLGFEIEQLRKDYNLDKKEDEISHQKEKYNLTIRFIVALLILLLLLSGLTVTILNILRIIRKKNHSLFNQIAGLTAAKKELMEFKDMMQNNLPALTEKWEKGEAAEDSLFQKIESYMQEKSPYTNFDYGRHELVIAMNTNEVYLAKAIKKGAGLTIHEYINRWRMEYATRLLLSQPNLTIEAIASDAGFASIRNFYRLFKEQHGMSPAEFRNYVVSEKAKN